MENNRVIADNPPTMTLQLSTGEKQMRIIVYGSGGVGGYFGGRLVQAGEEVIFIARGAHLEAIRQNGLKVESIKGNFTIQPALVEEDPGKVGLADVVLVCVKAWQVPQAAQAIRPVIGANTVVIPLENGVEASDQLAAVLEVPLQRPAHVAGGLCRISSQLASPGIIRHVAIEPYIAFGSLDGQPDARLEKLRQAFERAGVKAEIPQDIRSACWQKFIFIAAISGVGAVTRTPVGIFRAIPETRRMLTSALEEIAAVGRAEGVSLPVDAVQTTLAMIDNLPGTTLASMQRDIMDGRPSELEAQNGAVVRLGMAHGVSTPTHAFIYGSLLPMEQKARGELGF
jgi:2-dehydropantoate 2-reductase